MRILLTGATGYLGGKAVERLHEMNYELGCVVRRNAFVGKSHHSLPDVTLLYDDENLQQSILRFSPSCVIHMAGIYGRGQSDMEIVNSNLLFPLRILMAAKKAGIERWINIDTALPSGLNAYALSKANFVDWGRLYCRHSFHFINLSVEQFYGLNQPDEYFLSWVIKKLKDHETLYLTKGTQQRDLIHIDDVIRTITASITLAPREWFTEIPVCTGNTPTIREVVEYLKKITRSTSELAFGAVPMREGEPDSTRDTSGMRALGIDKTIDWKDGIKNLI